MNTYHVTLQLQPTAGRLVWIQGRQWQERAVSFAAGASAKDQLITAIETFVSAVVADEPKSIPHSRLLQHSRWRIVLPWGFYHLDDDKPADAKPVGPSLPAYPLPIDQLQTSSLPVHGHRHWNAALPREILKEWVTACDESGIICEGIWSSATALVEYLLERDLFGKAPFFWTDGLVRVEIAKRPDWQNTTDQLQRKASPMRVSAVRETPSCSWKDQPGEPADSIFTRLPMEWWPAGCASLLTRIDPSESLSFARDDLRAPDLSRRRQRPLAWGVAAAAAALLIWGFGNQIANKRLQDNAAAGQAQIKTIAQSALGAPSATPIATLEQQTTAWENIRKRSNVISADAQVLEKLSALVRQIPSDLPVTIQTLRYRQKEVWLDGSVHSQNDARRLEDAISATPQSKADPMRTISTEAGLVHFSIHLTF